MGDRKMNDKKSLDYMNGWSDGYDAKQEELISEFLESFDRILDKNLYDGRGIQEGHFGYSIKYPSEGIIRKERKKWQKKLIDITSP